MKRVPLLLAVVLLTALAIAVPLATGAAPQHVTIMLDETFTGGVPAVVGSFAAAGGVFGTLTNGDMQSDSFKPAGFAFASRDHFMVYTAADRYTTGAGSFSVNFEGSCRFVEVDVETGDYVAACAGNWQVNGGTGSYERLKGTGTYVEEQALNVYTGVGTGHVDLNGRMHVD